VLHVIEECRAAPLPLPDLQAVEALACSPRCSTAVVATGPPEGQLALRVIRTLTDKGFTVLAHEDGAGGWPLAARCRLLLAGCGAVLDSATGGFPPELARLLADALRAAAEEDGENRRVQAIMHGIGLVGESRAMLAVFRRVLRMSVLSDLATLITGETGTGKELIARALHAQDAKRRAGPFLAVNCGAITPTLAETELFGHRRGAFTGAGRDRKGLVRAAHGGVLFLDEIGELDAALQGKLLRVLQEGRVLAVGDEQDVAVSVRVVAATNADLPRLVAQGRFRADLFHRLNVLSIHVPPLRERRADIPPLIRHFARRHAALAAAPVPPIGADLVEALCRLALPGNARELDNLVRRAIVHGNGRGRLGLRDLPPEVWEQLSASRAPAEAGSSERGGGEAIAGDPVRLLEANGWSLARSLDSCERSLVETALRVSDGNQSRAARLLGITPRSVYNKVRRHHLERTGR
jgi:DNA-binding NtrC family response regulator